MIREFKIIFYSMLFMSSCSLHQGAARASPHLSETGECRPFPRSCSSPCFLHSPTALCWSCFGRTQGFSEKWEDILLPLLIDTFIWPGCPAEISLSFTGMGSLFNAQFRATELGWLLRSVLLLWCWLPPAIPTEILPDSVHTFWHAIWSKLKLVCTGFLAQHWIPAAVSH